MYRYFRNVCIFLCYLSYCSLTITGVPLHIKKNIEQRINYKVRPHAFTYNEQLSDQLSREALEAIKPFGYFNPDITVSAPQEAPSDITLSISLNQLTHIESIKVVYTVNDVDPLLRSAIKQALSPYEFSSFSVETLNDLSTAIKEASYSTGYYDVFISRGDTKVNRYTNLAQVTYLITPKDINQFGDIILPPNANSECFNRYHHIKKGEKFSEQKVREFQTNMMRSGLFSQSNITTRPRDLDPNVQDLIINYTQAPSMKYFLGFGLRSGIHEKQLVPQAQGTLNFQLGQCGVKLGQSFKYAKDTFILDSQLIFPSQSGMDNFSSLSFKFHNNNIKAEDTSKYFQSSIMTQRSLSHWKHQLSLNLLVEESTLNEENSYISNILFPQYKIHGHYHDKLNALHFKSKMRGGVKSLGSEFNFMQVTTSSNFRGTFHHIIGNAHLVLGRIWTDNFDRFPLSMQYYLGGPASHRGYKPHAINEGNKLFLSRNSLQFRLPKNILIGGFYDTGYCTNDDNQTLTPASGFLVSWVPSFGRFELSIGKRDDDDSWVVLFNTEPGEDLV